MADVTDQEWATAMTRILVAYGRGLGVRKAAFYVVCYNKPGLGRFVLYMN